MAHFRNLVLSGLFAALNLGAVSANAQSLEMKGAPVSRAAAVSAPAAPSAPAVKQGGVCRTVTVCAPPRPKPRPVAHCNCAPRPHRVVHRHAAIRREVEIRTVIERVPVLVQAPPPCPPTQAAPRLPADYPSAVQNGYLTWASRD
jgi:hypothetical protein